jgi:proteasome lid subunit RPN8/RPN11
MTAALILPDALRKQISAEATCAFPRECCGLIEGMRQNDSTVATALHPTRNLASRDDRFEIDPAEQFRLAHALRGTGRSIVGCYHSHPNGRAEPSEHDLGPEDGFIWLIAAVTVSENVALAAFLSGNNAFTAPDTLTRLIRPAGGSYKPPSHRCSHRLAVRTRPSQG